MIDPTKDSTEPKSGEDSLMSDITDKDKKDPKSVDGFKTKDDKEKRYYDKPFDEQMYNSFDDIREQQGQEPGKEEDK